MDMQSIFNMISGAFLLLGGWFLRIMWDTLLNLQFQDRELADKVARIEVLVAGEYVKKEDFDRVIERLFDKLDHIELKIDSKKQTNKI